MVAVALRTACDHTFGGRLSAHFDSFVLSPRGLFLRNPRRPSTLGHALSDSPVQWLAGLSPVVLPAPTETVRGTVSRCTSYASTIFGSSRARSRHRPVYALFSRAASWKRSGSSAAAKHGAEPRDRSRR